MSSRVKTFIHSLINIYYFLFSKKKKYYQKEQKSQKVLYLDLKENPYDRYLYLLLIFFSIENYKIVIRWRWGFWGSWSSRVILQYLGGVKMNICKPSKADLFISDHKKQADIFVSVDYFNENPKSEKSKGFHIPIPMVDTMYYFDFYNRPINLELNRYNSAIFVGRVEGYSKGALPKYFDIEDRESITRQINKRHGLKVCNRLSLVNEQTDVLIQDRSDENISPREWRQTLAKFDFFLALPGYSMPLSHNIVEAMSVGCIPILAYANWMSPPLLHDVNCITYQNGEITEVLKYAISLSHTVKEKMRKEVLYYYKKHLSVEQVVRKIESGAFSKILLCGEYNSVIKLR